MVDTGQGQAAELSKYNEAAFQILRLHETWVRVEAKIRSGNLEGWRWELDCIWRELYADVMRQSENKEIIKENIEHVTKAINSKNMGELYAALNARHEFLKHLQDKSGKGGSYGDGSDHDFE